MAEPNKPLEQMSAQERYNLGMSYFEKGRSDKAIKTWSTIRREEVDSKTYAKAQLGIGAAYKKQDKLDQAIKTWSNIPHDDDPEAYARAQLYLGIAYIDQNERNLDQAIETWLKVVRNENPRAYARTQLNLGIAYKKQGNLLQAINTWLKVHPDENPEAYARAQFNLGNTYNGSGMSEQAIKAWSKVRHDKDPKAYARAQFKLGVAYYKNKPGEAIKAWSKVRRDDDPDVYARAQFKLGEFYEGKREIEQAKDAYRNVQGPLYYRAQREYRILGCPPDPELINDLRSLAESTDEVRKSLQIIPEFESRVAHYSRALTAFNLFGDEKNDKEPSHFRLSTIRGVNDPAEGLVLNDYWDQQGIPETIHTNDTATFISCFTFNHDSLNQFRLYGKENGQEATGVSLVFKKEFFSDQSDTLEFIAAPSIDPSSNSGQDSSKEKEKPQSNNNKELIGKSTLYRCIYLDPETGYWTLAQRDKSTFYRQYKGEAKEKWKKYYESIPKKEGIVEKYLFAEDGEDNKNNSVLSILKSISEKLEESNAPEESHTYGIEEKQKILEAIRFILLPLQYLVKHIAFQEEQECRIMYITHLHDEKIRHDWEKQWMYVEYEEPVLPRIDKIYLSPGSAKYQDFFRILLDQKEDDEPDKKEDKNESKVRISQNPFRNKE